MVSLFFIFVPPTYTRNKKLSTKQQRETHEYDVQSDFLHTSKEKNTPALPQHFDFERDMIILCTVAYFQKKKGYAIAYILEICQEKQNFGNGKKVLGLQCKNKRKIALTSIISDACN